MDGQDVLAVRDAMATALERARDDYQPTLLEIRTYRFMGHSMSDAVSGTYRTKAELDDYLKRDPINLLEAKMRNAGEITDAGIADDGEGDRGGGAGCVGLRGRESGAAAAALYEDVLVETTSG